MKKRITQKDWNYIGTCNAGAKWVRPFCVYTLEEVEKGAIKQEVKINWFSYLLMFIPVHIFKIFWCLWDGGLKEFSLPDNYSIDAGSLWLADKQYIAEKWEKAEKLWERA